MSIQINRTTIMIGLVVLLALGLGLLGVLPAFSQVNSDGDEPVLAAEINSAVSEAITYQGRLTDNNGDPLSGNYTMRFRMYNVPSGGSALFDSSNMTMPVVGGLFTVSLPVPQNLFDGQPLWLLITVDSQNLSPRQEIRPAPYAMSLRPGAQVRQVATGTALRVESTQGIGIQGTGRVYGVYGNTSGAPVGSGYGGYFESDTGIGVLGRSTAATSTAQNFNAPGVYGFSQHGVGVVGESGASHNVGVLVIGNLVATGSKAGYVVDIARNDSDEPLQQGDLVVVTGASAPVLGNIPVPLVRKADSEANSAIIGVVDELYQPAENSVGRFTEGRINPGDYLTIVTLGAYMVVNVDAGYGAIQPGDLLVSSPTPGHAMRADNPAIGTVIGKALSGLESGIGSVAIMVTLQ